MSYSEEFAKRYNSPRMENIIVGFSGIDPSPKGMMFNPETPEEEQEAKSFVSQQIADYFSGGTVNFDSGVIGD